MIQENEGQYLIYKSIPNTASKKSQYQESKNNQNLYGTKSNYHQNAEQKVVKELSKKKSVMIPKTKVYRTQIQKSPKSNCQTISFSTNSTKKLKDIQSPKKAISNQYNPGTTTFLQGEYYKERLTQTQSDIEIMKSYQVNDTQIKTPKPSFNQVVQEFTCQYFKNGKKAIPQSYQNEHSQLMKTIKFYESKIKRLQKQIELKNNRISELERLSLQKLKQQCKTDCYLNPDNRYIQEQNRQIVRRLLNMLQRTNEYKQFAQFALDDNGIVFLKEANKQKKTIIDLENQKKKQKSVTTHFCSCHKQLIPESYLWVPESIYEYGKEFLKKRQDQFGKSNGFLSKSQYELLLYDLNKMWRERQKRIVNTFNNQKNIELQKLKINFNFNTQNRHNSANKFQK